jgi:hypothetical protein
MPETTVREANTNRSYVRRWKRYNVNVPIRVIIQRAMKSTIVQGRGSALSEGGMAIFAGAELKPGEHIAVEFTPPYSAPPVRVEARVCNRRGYDYGVISRSRARTKGRSGYVPQSLGEHGGSGGIAVLEI